RFRAARVLPGGRGTACRPCHDAREPSLPLGIGRDGRLLAHCFAGCPWRVVVAALGTRPGDWFPEEGGMTAGLAASRIVATYDYRDAAGGLLYHVVRYE